MKRSSILFKLRQAELGLKKISKNEIRAFQSQVIHSDQNNFSIISLEIQKSYSGNLLDIVLENLSMTHIFGNPTDPRWRKIERILRDLLIMFPPLIWEPELDKFQNGLDPEISVLELSRLLTLYMNSYKSCTKTNCSCNNIYKVAYLMVAVCEFYLFNEGFKMEYGFSLLGFEYDD
jgi:hypothetical protein